MDDQVAEDPVASTLVRDFSRLVSDRYESRGAPAQRAKILLDALPDEVRIGPHDHRIVKLGSFDMDTAYGYVDHKAQEIRVAHHSTPTALVDTFLHECLHGLWRCAALEKEGSKGEVIVSALGTGLVGLFRDNDWLAPWIMGALR